MTNEKDRSSVIRQIDENLKRVYREPLKDDAEVPERFEALLEQLRQREAGNDG